MRKNLKYFFVGIFSGLSLAYFINFYQKTLENFFLAQISKPFDEIPYVDVKKRVKKPPLEIDVKAAFSLRINPEKGERILYKKNEEELLPIASLTKLMTALVVFQNSDFFNLTKEIKISKNAASQIDVPEYGNLKEGQIKTVKELLELMLYWSSNDAAVALAEQMDNFIDKMNEKAVELNLNNTHFSNPTGIDPENLKWQNENKMYFNFSTAKDLVNLGKYILKEFPVIFEFSNQKNTFELLPQQKIIGIKTGYTNEAGGCIFVIFSDENDNYYLNVILGAKNKEERIYQMQKLINWINGKI